MSQAAPDAPAASTDHAADAGSADHSGRSGPPTPQPQRTAQPGLLARHHFLLRRLHSLTGVLPIGVFVFEHLYTNAAVLTLSPRDNYQRDVDFIWGLPGLIFLEFFGIWLPIGFHAALGMIYTFTGRPNSTTYTYTDNRRYTWMRITGVIALLFIFTHLATTRWHWTFWGLYNAPFDPDQAMLTTAWSVQYGWPAALIFYIVGALAVTYHFANGLWTFAITWGLTASVAGQRRWGWVCLVLGVLMAALWGAILWKFAVYPVPATSVVHTAVAAAR